MKKRYCFLFLTLATLVLMYSCTKDKTKIAPAVNCAGVSNSINTYALNISPNILQNYCAISGCHGGGSSQQGVNFDTYQNTVNAFETKNVICSLKNSGCILMPNTGRPLADSLILQMECWQQNGYPQ